LTVKKRIAKLAIYTRVINKHNNMQNKQKVTLYIPPELHRQLKIRAAIDTESMSAMVEKALAFYLQHPEKVEEIESNRQNTHQIHICPECDTVMSLKNGQMVSLKNQPTVIEEELPMKVREKVNSQGEEKLVTC
jgi:plasmid stability protein